MGTGLIESIAPFGVGCVTLLCSLYFCLKIITVWKERNQPIAMNGTAGKIVTILERQTVLMEQHIRELTELKTDIKDALREVTTSQQIMAGNVSLVMDRQQGTMRESAFIRDTVRDIRQLLPATLPGN